jgi:hypothetical protein
MDALRVNGTDVPVPTCEDIMSKHEFTSAYMLSRFAGVALSVVEGEPASKIPSAAREPGD